MLNERAMLVHLRRTRPRMTVRDSSVEAYVQAELGDKAYSLNKKLFRDPTNPVRLIMSALDVAYVTHKHYTQPYVDGGPRLLSMEVYPTYREKVSQCIDQIDRLVAQHMPDSESYARLVNLDVLFRKEQEMLTAASCDENRRKANALPPSEGDYPSFDDFRSGISVKLHFTTLPDAPHALFDDDRAETQRQMDEVANRAKVDAIMRMLKPVQHLSSKLALPVDATDPETGRRAGIFRDSAVENIKEAIKHVSYIGVNITPELQEVINELQQAVTVYDGNKEWLRDSPYERKAAHDKLSEIERKFGALMN